MGILGKEADNNQTLISAFTARMGEAIVRRNAEVEIRAARVEAELAIKARSNFLANMNHELRTPLNAIIGFATMLRDGAAYNVTEEQQKSYTEYILQSADLLLGHINTIIEVAALESGSVEIRDDEIDLNGVLREAVDRAQIQAAASSVEIEHRGANAPAPACGDRERAGQAVDHLLQTAIRFCKEQGRILVRTQIDESGWAQLDVRDNGAGLSADDVRGALNAFDHVHRGLDRSFSGPGVDYAVAKTFIEMQNGRFLIKSREGEGTLVRISLPPADRAGQEAKQSTVTEDGKGVRDAA